MLREKIYTMQKLIKIKLVLMLDKKALRQKALFNKSWIKS